VTRFARGAAIARDEQGDDSVLNGGCLYVNRERRGAADPDLTGSVSVEGVPFKVSARWVRARDGARALRLKFFPK